MAGFFKKSIQKISDKSPKLILYIAIANFSIAMIGMLIFHFTGDIHMMVDGKESTANNPEVQRTLIYTLTVIIINLTSQLMTGIFCIWKGNAFQLLNFGFLSIVNNTVLSFFWAYAGIDGVSNLSPFGEESEEVTFDVNSGLGWTLCITFIVFGALEVLLIKPAYDKLCWDTFQQIGSNIHIQTCYQNYEVAKGSWNLLLWFSGVEMSTIFFFEKSKPRSIALFITAIGYAIGIIAGYIALKNEQKRRLQLLILLIPVCIIGMFSIHYLRSSNRMYHYTMGKMNSALSFLFSVFYALNFLITLVYAGKSSRQFGKGIKNILNKEIGGDALEEGFTNVVDRGNSVVLNLD